MARWRIVDIWADDDPAIARTRAALAPSPPTEALEHPFPTEVAAESPPDDPVAEVASLTERLRDGDISVRDRLAALLARLR